MAVPKAKTTKSCRGMRRSHNSLKTVTVVENSKSGEYHRPHHVSPDGIYRNRQVTTAKVNK